MLKQLIKYLMAYKFLMVGVLPATLASTGAKMLYPWPMKLLVDNVLGKQPLYGHVLEGALYILALIALAYVLLAGLHGFTDLLSQRWLTKVNQKASLALSGDLYAQMQRLSLRFHDRARVGDMVTRPTADVEQLQKAFISGLSVVTISAFTVLGIAVTMFLVDWRFALVALVVAPPYFLIFSTFRSRVLEASRDVRSSEGDIASTAYETLSSIRVVKAFCREGREQKRFIDHIRSNLSLGSLRNQISIALQDTILFSGAIRDNIAYGRPVATDYDVLKAAWAATPTSLFATSPRATAPILRAAGCSLDRDGKDWRKPRRAQRMKRVESILLFIIFVSIAPNLCATFVSLWFVPQVLRFGFTWRYQNEKAVFLHISINCGHPLVGGRDGARERCP